MKRIRDFSAARVVEYFIARFSRISDVHGGALSFSRGILVFHHWKKNVGAGSLEKFRIYTVAFLGQKDLACPTSESDL